MRGEDEDQIDKSAWLPETTPEGKPFPVVTRSRKRNRNVIAVEGERGGREYRSLTRPLDLYVAQRRISPSQYRAGNRFNALWRYSILHARYARMRFGDEGGEFDAENQAIAPKEYLQAFRAISGDFERKMTFHVCCAEEYAGKRGSAMLALVSGLCDLVRHFSIDS